MSKERKNRRAVSATDRNLNLDFVGQHSTWQTYGLVSQSQDNTTLLNIAQTHNLTHMQRLNNNIYGVLPYSSETVAGGEDAVQFWQFKGYTLASFKEFIKFIFQSFWFNENLPLLCAFTRHIKKVHLMQFFDKPRAPGATMTYL